MSDEEVHLDANTEQLLQEIYERVVNSQLEDLDGIRDTLLQMYAELGGVITAFLELANLHQLPRVGEQWRKLEERAAAEEDARFAMARKRRTEDREWKMKHFCFILMVWGRNVVRFYGFAEYGQTKMKWLYKCARRWDFPGFAPIAKVLLFLRHRPAVKQANPRTKHIVGRPAGFMGEDLKIIANISHTPQKAYGEDFSITTLDKWTEEVREWTENVDGSVLVEGLTLKERQPARYAMYLLEMDQYGMVMQRDAGASEPQPPSTPSHVGFMSPPPSLQQSRRRGLDDRESSLAIESEDTIAAPLTMAADERVGPGTLDGEEDSDSAATTSSTSLTPLTDERTLIGSGTSMATAVAKQGVKAQEISPSMASDGLFLSRETTLYTAISDKGVAEIHLGDAGCEGVDANGADESADGAAGGEGGVGCITNASSDELVNEYLGQHIDELPDEDVDMFGDTRPDAGSSNARKAGADSLGSGDDVSSHLVVGKVPQKHNACTPALPAVQKLGATEPNSDIEGASYVFGETAAYDASSGEADSVEDIASELDRCMTDSPSEHAAVTPLLSSPSFDSMPSLISNGVEQSTRSPASSFSGFGRMDSWSDDESLDGGPGRSVSLGTIGGPPELTLRLPAGSQSRGAAVAGSELGNGEYHISFHRRLAGEPEQNDEIPVQRSRGSLRALAAERNWYTFAWVRSPNRMTWPHAGIESQIDASDQMVSSPATRHPNAIAAETPQYRQVVGLEASSVQQNTPSRSGNIDPSRIQRGLANAPEQAPAAGTSRSSIMRWKWLSSARSATLSSLNGNLAEADVAMYTAESFMLEAKAGTAFDKPAIIKERASDGQLHSIDSLVGELYDSYSATTVQVRGVDDSDCVSMAMPEFLNLVQAGKGSVTPLNLFGRFCAHEPGFLKMRRFRLLDILVRRAGAGGENEGAIGLDNSRGLTRSRLETDGAFAGPHAAFGGKWIRNLVGQKLIMFVPPTAMAGEWDTFARAGADWCRRGKQLSFLLEEGDVLFVPHSHVLADVAMGTGASIEGPVWDVRDTVETLRAAHWVVENSACADMPLVRRFDRILDQLPQLVEQDTSRCSGMGWDLQSLHQIPEEVRAFKRVLNDSRRGGAHDSAVDDVIAGDRGHFDLFGRRGCTTSGQEKRRRTS